MPYRMLTLFSTFVAVLLCAGAVSIVMLPAAPSLRSSAAPVVSPAGAIAAARVLTSTPTIELTPTPTRTPTPTPRPKPRFLVGGGLTGIQVQNLAAEPATIVADVYGDGVGSFNREMIPPRAATSFFFPSLSELGHEDWHGVILSSDRHIGAIARREWPSTGRAMILSSFMPGNEGLLPLAVKGFAGQETVALVQNTDPSQPAQMWFEIWEAASQRRIVGVSYEIGPGDVRVIDLQTDPCLARIPDGFLGWVHMTSETSLVAHGIVTYKGAPGVGFSFPSVPVESADQMLFAPLVRNHFHGSTGIALVNPTSRDAEVTLTYYGGGGDIGSTCAGRHWQHDPIPVPLGGLALIDLGADGSPLPVGCLASAVIQSESHLHAIINDAGAGYPPSSAAAYSVVPRWLAPSRVSLPLVRNQHTRDRLTTGVQVMNASDEPTTARITFWDSAGTQVTGCGDPCTTELAPYSAHTWFLPQLEALPVGEYGTAMVEGGAPIAVVAFEIALSGGTDSAAYTGIPWPPFYD